MGDKVPKIPVYAGGSQPFDARICVQPPETCCGVSRFDFGKARKVLDINSCKALKASARPFAAEPAEAAPDAWKARLYAPTFFTKIGELYFIVDCWHNRVLYTEAKCGRMDWDLSTWKAMDGALAGPHSIASDGELYVVDNTGRGSLRIYQRTEDGFEAAQEIGPLGERMHRVLYDPKTESFYALGARSQEISKLVRDGDGLRVEYTKKLPFLEGRYSRSMTIIDGTMYFVSNGPGAFITQVRYADDSYEVLRQWQMPEQMQGMNDVFRSSDGWFYVTYSSEKPGGMRARSLGEIAEGGGEDLKKALGLDENPYYLTEIDGRIYVPEISIDGCNGIHSFRHGEDGEIVDVRTHASFYGPLPKSIEIKDSLPK